MTTTAEQSTGENKSPFTAEQQEHIRAIATQRYEGANTMEGYVLMYIAQFGVAPTSSHLVNRWQAHGDCAEGIHSAFPNARDRAVALLERIGVEQQGHAELKTGFFPGQPTDSHTVPRFQAVRDVLDSLSDEERQSFTD